MNLGEWIIIGLSAFLLIWYIAMNIFNRRRGIATYQWLRRGLVQVGEITESQWLGSSGTGARIVVAQAKKPFRRLEVMYLLETREILPYWIISHLRGRRDELIIKASLRTTPKIEIEVVKTNNRAITELDSLEPKQASEQVQSAEGFSISRSGHGDDPGEKNLIEFLSDFGKSIQRISLKRQAPHLELRIGIKPLLITNSESFFSMLQAWLL
jgi:hypothetical protein